MRKLGSSLLGPDLHRWHRPIMRTYAYNMDVGQNYYQPIKDFVDHRTRERGKSPGAMDFGERLLYKWPEGRRCGGSHQDRSSRANSMEKTSFSPPPEARAKTSPPSSTVFKGFTACELEADKGNHQNIAQSSNVFKGFTACELEADKGFRLRQLEAAKAVNFKTHESKAAATVAQELKSMKTTLDRVASTSARNSGKASRFSTITTTTTPSVGASGKESLGCSQALQPRTTHVHQGMNDVPSYNRYHAIKTHVMDDICKKVADIHMAPFQYGCEEFSQSSPSTQARWNQVNQLEEDLATLMAFKSSMKNKSSYSKSSAKTLFAL